MDLDPRADELEEPRHDVDLDFQILHGAKQLERLLMRVVREGDDDALDIQQADDRREAARIAEHRHVLEVLSAVLRLGVDEADEIDPVLRVVEDLLREQLADVARTDDDGVLDVGLVPACKRPRPSPGDTDERDRGSPEDDELLHGRMRDVAQIRDHNDEPGADGDHVEDAAEVVGGRVVGALVVVVVEAVELRDHHPCRNGEQEGEDLPSGRVGVGDLDRGREPLRHQERSDETYYVGKEQHPPHEPAAPLDHCGASPAVEDLQRALVDRRPELFLELQALQQRRFDSSRSSATGLTGLHEHGVQAGSTLLDGLTASNAGER